MRQEELLRILPGNMGKMFAINYGQFLDEPLDTKEKEKAWMDLINLLDSKEEVQYEEDIKELIDDIEKYLCVLSTRFEKFNKILRSSINK